MKKLEINDIQNVLSRINLTSSEIERQVAKLKYTILRDRGAEGKLPIQLVPHFYILTIRNNAIPTQAEYWNECLKCMHSLGYDYEGYPEAVKKGIKARIVSRTYPSLIRDVHFCKMLAEMLNPERYEVLYDCELDIEGTDVLLWDKVSDVKYGICLFLDTRWARVQVLRKRRNRPAYDNVTYVEFPMHKRNSSDTGIWLYGREEVARLMELLEHPDRYLIDIDI